MATFLWLLLVVGWLAGSASAQAELTVSGTITDAAGAPVSDAAVDLFQRQGDGNARGAFLGFARSDEDGRFSFEVAEACFVLVFIAPEGEEYPSGQYQRAVACTQDGSAVADARLLGTEEPSASIGGTVTNADGSPSHPARVHLNRAGPDGSRNGWLGSVQTIDGQFAFDVAPGCYVLDIAAPEGGSFNRRQWFQTGVCVEADEQRTDVSAQLDPVTSTSIHGFVKDDRGRAVGGVGVDLYVECCGQGTRSEFLGSTRTAGDGQYSLRLVEGGCYGLVFVAPDGYSFNGDRFAERRTCLETGDVVYGLSVNLTADQRVSRLSGEVVRSTNIGRELPQISLFRAQENGDRGDFIEPVLMDTFDWTFSVQVGAGCYWLVFEAQGDTSFDGNQFVELPTCVEAFEEVTDIAVLLGASDGSAYVEAHFGPIPEVVEPDEGFVLVPVPVRLDRAWQRPLSVFYSVGEFVSDGPPDVEPAEGELVFAPGETEAFIQVKVLGNTVHEEEPDGIFIRLEAPDANGELNFYTAAGLTVIDNDEAVPFRVVVEDVAAYEEHGDQAEGRGLWRVQVRMELDGRELRNGESATIPWELRDGTATVADGDYVAQSGELFFGYYQRRQEIVVEVRGDDRPEPDETFEVVLLPPTEGEAIIDEPGVFLILDDDETTPIGGLVDMEASTVEVEEGSGSLFWSVLAEHPVDFDRAVTVVLHDGTATEADGDFYGVTTDIYIPAGESVGHAELVIVDDDVVEPDETFTATLVHPSPGMTIDVETMLISIVDDD